MTEKNNKIEIFYKRLNQIGIELGLIANYPWIYLYSLNGNKVKEKFMSEHAFVLGYVPIRGGQEASFTDLKHIFKTIRKYRKGKIS